MRSLLSAILFFALSALPVLAADYSRDPVLMVHGYFLPDFATWASIEGKLIDDGWPEEYLFGQTFDSVVGCNPNHAEAIAASVEMIREVTGRDKVDLLAHSMGALDCRYYIKYLCGYKYVNDVVMLAGANHGSVVACLDPLSCGAEQMCIGVGADAWTGNSFLADLNACDSTPGDDILYTSIWSEWDEIIIPASGSVLDGALNHELDSFAEHATILLNNEAYDWVKIGLLGGGSNNVGSQDDDPCVSVCKDPVEPGPEITEVAEPVPDVVEGGEAEIFEEIIEEVIDEQWAEDHGLTKDHAVPEETTEDRAGVGDIPGEGHVADLAPDEDDSGPAAPVHYLPPTRSGGCSAGAAPAGAAWHLLAALLLVMGCNRRRLRGSS